MPVVEFNLGPLFDAEWYLKQYPDVLSSGMDPLLHFIKRGAAEGRDPFPLFHCSWYLQENPDVRAAGINPLEHYVRHGIREGRQPCELFQPFWYLDQYRDVARTGMDPLLHFVKHGAAEGRNPSPFFDTGWYLNRYPDVRRSGANPLEHYLRRGRIEGREPRPPRRNALSGYDAWRANHEALETPSLLALERSIVAFRWRPRFSIVVPTFNTPEYALLAFLDSVKKQVYPDWELCIADDASTEPHVRKILSDYAYADARIRVRYRAINGHISEATNSALELATGDYMCLMDHDDEIAPNALYEFAIKLNENPDYDFIYSDEDKVTPNGRRYEPFFKPDWSPEMLEACMYTAHFGCYRMSLVRKIGGLKNEFNGAQDYDFVLRFTEHVHKVAHVAKILYHWRAVPGSTATSMDRKDYVIEAAVRALEGRVMRTGQLKWVRPNHYKGCFDVRRAIDGAPKISILIPSAGRDSEVRGKTTDLLVNCIEKIVRLSTYTNYEIIIIHNGDLRATTVRQLAGRQICLVQYDEPIFNFSKKLNLGARRATGEYLITLNDDIEVISPDWIEAMLSIGQNPQVGVVGSKLYFEDDTIQHVGVAFWDGLPDHIRRGFVHDDPGYFYSNVGQRNYLAVTGACALTRRSLFDSVGGYDEDFAINYNDVDYCLKIYQKGLRIVFAPQAELFHFESRSRARSVSDEEIGLFRARWVDLVKRDPYYSPYFDAHPPNFRIKEVLES